MLFENVNKILMIQKITIEGYKSIKEQTVELFPINILIGGNGIGKSNFISAFTLIHNLYERNLQNYVLTKGGSDSLLYMGKKETDHLSFDLFFAERGKDAHNRFIVNMKEAQDSLFIERIDTAYHNGVSWHKQLHEVNKQESSFKNDHTGQAFYVNSFLREFEVYHFHDTGDRSPMKGKCNMDDNVSLKNNGANIAAFLYYLKEKHPKHFTRIEKAVASVSPYGAGAEGGRDHPGNFVRGSDKAPGGDEALHPAGGVSGLRRAGGPGRGWRGSPLHWRGVSRPASAEHHPLCQPGRHGH